MKILQVLNSYCGHEDNNVELYKSSTKYLNTNNKLKYIFEKLKTFLQFILLRLLTNTWNLCLSSRAVSKKILNTGFDSKGQSLAKKVSHRLRLYWAVKTVFWAKMSFAKCLGFKRVQLGITKHSRGSPEQKRAH